MSSTFQTNAIVLKRKDFREKDRLVTFFTEDYGKIQAQAISVKKFESKLAGHLEPFVYTRIMIANGRRIDKVTGSVMIDVFPSLRSSLVGVSLASYITEIVDAFTREAQRDSYTFVLLLEALVACNELLAKRQVNRRDLTATFDRFMLRFLRAQGFDFDPLHCGMCGADLGENAFFSLSHGFLCTSHSTEHTATPVERQARQTIALLGAAPYAEALALNVSHEMLRRIHRMLASFTQYHFETRLRSEIFVRKLFLS